MASLNEMFHVGCGDSSCAWGRPGGQHTNGGCRCEELGRGTSQLDISALQRRLEITSGIHLLNQLADLPKVEKALRQLVKMIRKQERRKEKEQGNDAVLDN